MRLTILGVKWDCATLSDSPGKRLSSFRKSRGLSQRALAASLGVSGGLIGQLEADISQPSRAVLEKISNTYGVSAEWLLNGRGEMNSENSKAAAAHRLIDSVVFMVCAGSVRDEYESLGIEPNGDKYLEDVAWAYNEILARLTDPDDGDELEATLPQVRHLLRKRIARA